MRFIDLFGGIGGFRFGIEKATKDLGWLQQENKERPKCRSNKDKRELSNNRECNGSWKCVGYYDIDKYATQTYNKNFGTNHEAADIRGVRSEDIPEHDLICAGFPCQSFSIAGKRLGFKDTRGTLFYEILRIARFHKTKYLLLENVKGLLSHSDGRSFALILTSLWESGYDVQWQCINSKHFGVPQNRERVFIIASLRGEPRPKVFPIGINAGEIQEVLGGEETMIFETGKFGEEKFREYAKGTPTLQQSMGTGGNNVPMVHSLYPRSSKTGKGGIGHLTRDDDASFCVDCGNMQAVEQRNKAPKVVANRYRTLDGKGECFETNNLSNSLTKVAKDNYIYSGKLRRLTPIECERLQGFPDNWTEGVSDTQRYKQLGNAVTTNVIEAIVRNWRRS